MSLWRNLHNIVGLLSKIFAMTTISPCLPWILHNLAYLLLERDKEIDIRTYIYVRYTYVTYSSNAVYLHLLRIRTYVEHILAT